MGHDIYICYDEKDLSVAEEIVHLFEDNGIICFFKKRDMEGLEFYQYEWAIQHSRAFVLILSNNAHDSPYVENEVIFAFVREIPIITYKIDNCNLGLFEFFISFPLSIDAYPNYKDEFEHLLSISAIESYKPLDELKLPKNRSILSRFKKRNSIKNITLSKNMKLKSNDCIGFTHDVFISYSPKNGTIADEICDILEYKGIKCWIAPRDIDQSENIYIQIINAIERAKIVLLVFSRFSQQSKFIQKEIEIAFNRKKPILSFNIDNTLPEPDMEYYLKIQQWIAAFPNPQEKYDALVNTIFEMKPEASILVPGQGRLPYPAYRGNNEYIFVSYAHKDANLVFEEIRRFQDLGYNIWYDEGIGAGNEWLRDIVAHLKNCKMFVVFVTNNSMASVNVQKEIKYAVKHNKNIMPIYLEEYDDIEMEDDIDFELSVVPDISKEDMSEEEYVSKAKDLFAKYGF